MKTKLKPMRRPSGKLLFLDKQGKTTVIAFNKPFDVLQNMKSEYSRHQDYKDGKLLLTYA